MSPSTVPLLCDFCKSIADIATSLEGIKDIPYHKSLEGIKTASLNGCKLCAWVLENFPKFAISKIKNLEYIVQAGVQYFALMFLIEKAEALKIEKQGVPLGNLDNLGMFFQAFYNEGRPLASTEIISARKIVIDPVEAIPAIALPWISVCESTHESCRQSRQIQLPSRVLKVENKSEDVVLIDSRSLTGRYTILSYSWGLGTSLKTTPETLAARERGIPYDDLPLTLRHAVKVTRELGVKYLWIDALCIIQDQNPPVDWLAESGKMLDYYRNAYVTIGNLDGEASSSGFLFPRKDISLRVPGYEKISMRITPNRIYWSIYDQSVLATRAWCLQERLISTRLLLFGKDQMFWECRTCCEREGIIVSSNNKRGDGSHIRETRIEELEHEMIRVLAGLGTDGMSLGDSMNIWYSIVEQYTSRRLTRATDILIAISGVATEIQRRTGLDYVHGLWKQDLCRGLAWNRRPGGELTGAPSWSWASKIGLVGFKVSQTSEDRSYNTTFEDQIELLESPNDGGELYVRAKCRTIDSKEVIDNKSKIKTNVYVFWDVLDGRNHVELDMHDEDLPRTMYKALNTLLRYSYIVEAGLDDELLLSGYFAISYLLLAPDDTFEGKWRRIGLGTYQRDIVPKTISFEDLGSEDMFQADRVRPELMFDDCEYENVCIV